MQFVCGEDECNSHSKIFNLGVNTFNYINTIAIIKML